MTTPNQGTPKEPWRPSRLIALVVIATPVAAGVLAWNWRRLNKEAWFRPAMILSVVPILVLFAIGFFTLVTLDTNAPEPVFIGALMLILIGAGFEYGMVFTQWYLQGGAWQQYQDKPNWEELAQYDYPLRNGAIMLAAFTILFPLAVGIPIFLD